MRFISSRHEASKLTRCHHPSTQPNGGTDLEFALLPNLFIGLVDGGDLLGGDSDELFR